MKTKLNALERFYKNELLKKQKQNIFCVRETIVEGKNHKDMGFNSYYFVSFKFLTLFFKNGTKSYKNDLWLYFMQDSQ